jgi:heme d1 biosynthesis radical SAM protein NirJ
MAQGRPPPGRVGTRKMSSIGHTGPAPKPLIHIKAIPPPLPSNGPVLSGDWPMFRISQYMQELSTPKAPGPKQNPPAPVVIWNLLRRCNLTCKHCYSISTDRDFPGELSTDEVFTVMDDLKRFRVPVLILSGGEPLLRPDLFAIARRAKSMGFYVGLSSNGTLIKADNIESIVECDFDYVGVSLDGIGETHDRFRQMKGAFEASLQGIRLCRDLGLKIGVRFTMTQDNAQDLPRLLELVENEGIDRFYFSHLNYAGRGNKNRQDDAQHQLTRWAMDLLFATCWDYQQRGLHKEFTSGNNDADGVYFLHWVARRFPEQAANIHARLIQWGGNSSGVNVANIGNVHPDTMWWHHSLGNVRQRPFSAIWTDLSEPLMAGLKAFPRRVSGRCGECLHFNICNGNTRVRAQQLTGDAWAEDPGCYLDDEEIGIAPGRERLAVTPYVPIRRA